MSIDLVLAREFALAAHDGQLRKYTFDHYYLHLMEVMGTVALVTTDRVTLAGSLLHDSLEDQRDRRVKVSVFGDTEFTVSVPSMTYLFGDEVADLVVDLTDIYTHENYPTLPRDERKRLEAERLAATGTRVQTAKVADLISNTASIAKHDPGFMRTYGPEKRRLLNMLTKADRNLWRLADAQLRALGY